MSIISTTKMTARQFLELGEDPPGVRLELVDGEVALSPSPIPAHSHVVTQLTALLVQHVKTLKLGRVYQDVDTIFGTFQVRRPDVLYYSNARLHFIGDKAMEGPPDLAVEVISPSSGAIDRKDKFREYEQAGIEYYWIIDPRPRAIEGFRLMSGKYTATGAGNNRDIVRLPPFEALEIPLQDLWQPET